MRRSTLLLCAAAAVGLAACGSKDDAANLANNAANAAANTANTAANTTENAVNATENATAGAANTTAEAANTADTPDEAEAVPAVANTASTADETVNFRGCPRIVKVSKPSGCLVVKSDNGTTYEIDSAKPRPKPGRRIIEGTGVEDPDSAGVCMTGKHLKDVKWHSTELRCPMTRRAQGSAKRRG